ncbi:MAG: AzlD domain-containing protein [Gammaproteobacteria bacterium]|nr:AzlD domain-containing protein [Gammaproteobacteria bacterium]
MIWLTIALMAVITFSNRALFFARSIRYQMGARVRRLLTYSSYAILTAIWAPILLRFSPQYGISHAGADYLVGTVLAMSLTMLRLPTLAVVLISAAVFFAIRFGAFFCASIP